MFVLSGQTYNGSRLATLPAVAITSSTELATLRKVFLPAAVTGLPRDSIVNVTAVVTHNKTDLSAPAGLAPLALLREVERDLPNVLDL